MSKNNSHTWIGWQGIIAEVPAAWSLAAVSGDEKSGYFRVDSAGSLTLEIKWASAGKQVDLLNRLNAYLNDMKRKSRKRRADFESKIKSKDGAYTFTWRSDRKAQGKLWWCDECGRVIIAQISGSLSDDVSNMASFILPTIQDHSEDGWRAWAVYDLITEVPSGYVLEKHQLMSGYIQLIFRKANNRLVIERWGIADVALRKCSLREWFEARAIHDLKQYQYSINNVEFDNEAGIEVRGKRFGIRQIFKSASELLMLKRPALYLDGYVWVCEESNKIYSVQSLHSSNEDVLDDVLERVECH